MKIQGQKLQLSSQETLVIPKGNQNILFLANPVDGFNAFDALCPHPKAPSRMLPGGVIQQNVEDPAYKDAMDKWAVHRFHWMTLESLKATPNLEWETVDASNPETWGNFESELKDAGFKQSEINQIVLLTHKAMGLTQSKIEEATASFLAGQAEVLNAPSSQIIDLNDTPNGEPANASA